MWVSDEYIKIKIMENIKSHHSLNKLVAKIKVEKGKVSIDADFEHPIDVTTLLYLVGNIMGIVNIEITPRFSV